MDLKSAQIQNFRCIEDSEKFLIDRVTALVGKNESGKTAILKALYMLKPDIQAGNSFTPSRDYPRRKWRQDPCREALIKAARRLSEAFSDLKGRVGVVTDSPGEFPLRRHLSGSGSLSVRAARNDWTQDSLCDVARARISSGIGEAWSRETVMMNSAMQLLQSVPVIAVVSKKLDSGHSGQVREKCHGLRSPERRKLRMVGLIRSAISDNRSYVR